MKLLKRTLILVTLLISCLLTYAGGGQETVEKVTIKFESDEVEFPQEFIDRFNAQNPDIELVRIDIEWNRRIADMMAGTAADLLLIATGTSVGYFSRRGLLLDITARLKNSAVIRYEDIDLLGNSSYRFDGEEWGQGPWYGLSKDYNNIGCITYNRVMFDEAGLSQLSETEPITYYDDLYGLARKLTKKDQEGRNLIWGIDFSLWWVGFLVSDMAYAEGLSLYADQDRSKMNEDPRVRSLWEYWLRFSVEDIGSNFRNVVPQSSMTGFQNDRVAMVQLGYWYGAMLMENEGYETKYGWAPTPILRPGAGRVTNTLGATGYGIYSKTKHPDEAFRVFEYYIGGEYGLERAKTGWGIPPLLSLRKYLPVDNAYNRSRTRIALDDAKYFVPWQASPHTYGGLGYVEWDDGVKDVVEKVIDEEGFIDRLYADLNATLKRGKEELGL